MKLFKSKIISRSYPAVSSPTLIDLIMVKRLRVLLCWPITVSACSLLLLGCDSGNAKHVGQSLATVNGTDITVHQVNAELRDLPTQTAEKPAEQQKKALEQVIDRELLAAKATENKLDRDPNVMLAIERSKSQILAQAYLQSRVSLAGKPTDSEISDYIDKHPQLFANRKLYNLHFLAMPSDSLNSDISAQADHAKSLDDMAAVLNERKVAFSEGQAYRTTADLPPQLLANLDAINKHPVFIMRDGSQAMLASLVFVKDAPVAHDEAVQQVEKYLSNTRVLGAAHDEVARLRGTAKIDYAKGSEPQPAPAAAEVASNKAAASDKSKSAIESGVAGLR